MRALAFLALRCAAPPRRVLLRALTGDGENVHAAWTKEDDWKLWKHRDDADVAELLGRKAGGVAARLFNEIRGVQDKGRVDQLLQARTHGLGVGRIENTLAIL